MSDPQIETSLLVEFEELFALKDRLGAVADQTRARLAATGWDEKFETDIFERELELRSPEPGRLAIRLDPFRLEITGAPVGLQTHLLAAIILEEAGAYRLATVEAGFTMTLDVPGEYRLGLVEPAFTPDDGDKPDEPMLDRRFSMTWEWGTATTGYSFLASTVEDKDLFLSLKAREGYLTLEELQSGAWLAAQASRFDKVVQRFMARLGWDD